jgi:hypothetical protein
MKAFLALSAAVLALVAAAHADDLSNTNSGDKSQYTLLRPTPDNLLRPLESDEYDGVLDAHTLDAGHLQLESSLVNFYYYSSPQLKYNGLIYRYIEREYNWAPRFSVGLWNNVDLEARPTYSQRTINDNGAFVPPNFPFPFNTTSRRDDFGDITIGPKINLWGNDEGPTALAVKPYLSVPTDHGDILGGVDIPFGWRLPYGFYVKLDTDGYLTDDSAHTHYLGFDNSVSVHKSLCSRADAFWYLDSTVTTQSSRSWYGYTGFGLVCSVTRDLQLFASMGFGLDSSAYDYNPRVGVVLRY